jgi:hypothetical protein
MIFEFKWNKVKPAVKEYLAKVASRNGYYLHPREGLLYKIYKDEHVKLSLNFEGSLFFLKLHDYLHPLNLHVAEIKKYVPLDSHTINGSKGATYLIEKMEAGNYKCDCRSFKFSKKKPKICKHIKEVYFG